MSKIPEEVIDRVRQSVNILDVVSMSVQMQKKGKNWFGLCPFHAEKTPSFSVNEEKQIFNCFSCHRGGNVFKFLMDINPGMTFKQAVQKVAEIGNVKLDNKYFLESAHELPTESAKFLKIYQQVCNLYHHILVNTTMGEQALFYLHSRGISDEIIEEFKIGYAPKETLLESFLKEKGFSDYQLLRKSGLFFEDSNAKLSERFSKRVMFPIRNINGDVVAFSGRLLVKSESSPKYLNSPETAIFDKSSILFNFDKAKKNIKSDRSFILFEGFMDVISAYQANVLNGIASMGTSLTSNQINQIERIANALYICYDGDSPGRRATKRALEMITPLSTLKIGVIQMPKDFDPDEFIKKYGRESFENLILKKKDTPIDFYINYFKDGKDLNNESNQLEYLDNILKEVAKVPNKLEQDLYLSKLSVEFNISKDLLNEQLFNFKIPKKQTRRKIYYQKKENFQDRQYSKVQLAEMILLYRLLHSKEVLDKLKKIDFEFLNLDYQTIFIAAESYFNSNREYDTSDFLDFLENPRLQNLLSDIELKNYSKENNLEEVDDCISVVKNQVPLESKIEELKNKFKQAKSMSNEAQLTKITSQLIELYRQQKGQ